MKSKHKTTTLVMYESNHCIVAGKGSSCHHGHASGPGLTAVEDPEEETGEDVLERPVEAVIVQDKGDRVIGVEEERESCQRSPKRQGSSVYDRVRAKLSRSLRSLNSEIP